MENLAVFVLHFPLGKLEVLDMTDIDKNFMDMDGSEQWKYNNRSRQD